MVLSCFSAHHRPHGRAHLRKVGELTSDKLCPGFLEDMVSGLQRRTDFGLESFSWLRGQQPESQAAHAVIESGGKVGGAIDGGRIRSVRAWHTVEESFR